MKLDSVHDSVNIAGPANPVFSSDKPADRELIQAVKAVNAAELFGADSELTFLFDRETRRPVVRIVSRETREVIRQIPPEYVLRMAEEARRIERGESTVELADAGDKEK